MSQEVLKNLIKEEVVVIYTRVWFEDFYTILASKIEIAFACKVVFFSDYKIKGVKNISPLKKNLNILKSMSFINPPSEYFDIIKRDRVLRNCSHEEALTLLRAYETNITKFFDQYSIKFLFSATVDQFAIDMCYRHCLKAEIPFIGYHMSVVPGYTLLTNRGEACSFREPSEEETSAAIKLITPKSFRPDYIPKKGKLKSAGFRRLLKNIARVPYFFFRDIFSKEYNYHYKASLQLAYSMVSTAIVKAILDSNKKLGRNDKFDLYIPLQLHPECNSEYWSRAQEYRDYADTIYDFCKKYATTFRICMKEHPNMVGRRGSLFYKKFTDIGVILVDVEEDNRVLIERSTVVVTYNSSVGIEGLIYGAQIFCIGQPYYLTEGHLSKEQDMVKAIKDKDFSRVKKDKDMYLRDAIRKTLSMSLIGLLPDTITIRSHKKNKIEQIATSFSNDLKKYFDKITASKLKLKDVFTYKVG